MKEIVGQNLFKFTAPGSMGVVNDTRFVKCYWPELNEPTALFLQGSSGIEVQGAPSPRNVVFPDDTVFLPVLSSDGRLTNIPTKNDCFYLTEEKLEEEERDVEVIKNIEVEHGLRIDVKYLKPSRISEMKKIKRNLSVEQAKLHAASKVKR